jgi:hypothetical protein
MELDFPALQQVGAMLIVLLPNWLILSPEMVQAQATSQPQSMVVRQELWRDLARQGERIRATTAEAFQASLCQSSPGSEGLFAQVNVLTAFFFLFNTSRQSPFGG